MLYRLLFVGLFLLPSLLEAQQLKLVKKRSKYLLEQFEVLADNDTIREGRYKKLFLTNRQVLEEGHYEENQRVGVWTFYGANNVPELQYNYSTKKVISTTRFQHVATLAQIPQADTLAQVYIDNAPVYLASSEQIWCILLREIHFPARLYKAGLRELSFKITATVSEAGPFYRVTVSHPSAEFTASCNKAMRLAFSGVKWVSAAYQQRPVTAMYQFEKFTLMAPSMKIYDNDPPPGPPWSKDPLDTQ
ncbi:hypothetical protein [Fibrella aquatilis]|uniref:TonB C-terminal domain-containing protein n=1 Tax=Fibrella aquatilis TaxID=2817059 RepID=A0A939K109_9BACT|nr:hypothetical protein [Fibrella aquatilis]MBO0932561.1 hypothetical protein [Fibrella aquatilis]